MIVSDPASNKSPEGLDAWVGAPSGCLFRLTTYWKQITTFVSSLVHLGASRVIGNLPNLGYYQRFFGASLAVNGVYDFSYRFEIMCGIF